MNEVLRQEKKFLININEYIRLRHYFDQLLTKDRHGGIDGYVVRSLYFDTINNKDYFEKEDGIELRRKIRLRVYDPSSDFAMLEMKQKQGMYQKKRSLKMKREDAIQLTKGDYRPLLNYKEDFAAECYGLMCAACYRPVSVVEYHRLAYVSKENQIRITFDQKIEASESCFDLFSDKLNLYSVFDPFNVVMEVKYNGFLLSHIKNIINSSQHSELSVSKYSLSRSITMKYIF